MNRIVEIFIVGTIIAVALRPRGVHSNDDFFSQGEPSQHVMHIRKLSDSDRLKIELEPVWFHLESTDRRASSDSQQVKRQTRDGVKRPHQIFSSLEHLAMHRNQNDKFVRSKSLVDQSNEESFLKNFWHIDDPNDFTKSNYEPQKTSKHSVEQYLKDTKLPSCFQKYLHEMYDRNHESIRKLMHCLAQNSDEHCNEARRSIRLQPNYFSSQEESYYPNDDPQDRLPERKVIRKRKYNGQHAPHKQPEYPLSGELKFEKQFIRSDSDYGGHIFETVADEESENGSSETGSSSIGDEKSQEQNSNESEQIELRQASREYNMPYRRLPQKYNTSGRYHQNTEESEQDCCIEDSDESCEHC